MTLRQFLDRIDHPRRSLVVVSDTAPGPITTGARDLEDIDVPDVIDGLEEGPNEWNGFWTYRRPLVEEIETYITTNL